ncbi:MAG: hypothetical protein MZW92_07135 [Comamonadaceae bacterium]|nr:hypothetical protein [Comamonadaceae bacterium]
MGGDTATVTVTPVNDAPTLDLNGGAIGNDYTAIFRPRGDAVAIVGAGVSIGDADVLDAGTPDTISSATVTLDGRRARQPVRHRLRDAVVDGRRRLQRHHDQRQRQLDAER